MDSGPMDVITPEGCKVLKDCKSFKLIQTVNTNTIEEYKESSCYTDKWLICKSCLIIHQVNIMDFCILCGNVDCGECNIKVFKCWDCYKSICTNCSSKCCKLCRECVTKHGTYCKQCNEKICYCKRASCDVCNNRVCNKHFQECKKCYSPKHCSTMCEMCKGDFCIKCVGFSCEICKSCDYKKAKMCHDCIDIHHQVIIEEFKEHNPDFVKIKDLVRNYKI